jgi:hypothetical protein
MNNLIPMEFGKQRIMTTKILAEQFGTEEKNIQMNFLNNQNRFKEGKHFIKLEGQALKEFKNSLPNDIGLPLKFASVLTLWTDRGAARHAKILDTDEAWDIYEQLEENYFNPKKPRCIEDVLIQSLEEMKDMRLTIEQTKRVVLETKDELENVREVIEIKPSESWRNETNALVKKICYQLQNYQKPKEDIYKALQERAACDLKRRLENMRARLLLNGGSKSKANDLNYLDVIAEDKKLVEIYTTIVKEMAIKYKVA